MLTNKLADVVLTEDSTTLNDIGHLLEQIILKGMLPGINQDHTTRTTTSIELPISESQVSTSQISPVPESGHSGERFHMDRSPSNTYDTRFEQQEKSSAAKVLASPQPSLFQRTLALSDGLKELRDDMRHVQSDPPAKIQWLAIGGEPGDLRSLSPSPEHDAPSGSPPQAHCVEPEVLQLGLTNRHVLDVPSESEHSDLIMLDGQPKDIGFSRCKKHSLPTVEQDVQTAKRPKILDVEPSTGMTEQPPQNTSNVPAYENSSKLRLGSLPRNEELPRNHFDELRARIKMALRQISDEDRLAREVLDESAKKAERSCTTGGPNDKVLPSTTLRSQSLPLGHQDPVSPFKFLPLPSAITARQFQKLWKQRDEPKSYLQHSVDHFDKSTIDDKTQTDKDAAIGLSHNNDNGPQIDTGRLQPLRAVPSLQQPSHGDKPR